jgi:hypothetical protein
MSDNLQTMPRTLPPHLQLLQMNAGSLVSRVQCAAAKLGLADHLAAGPRSASELAGPLRRTCSKVTSILSGADVAGTVEESGCKLTWPA